jgi:hypothetical protein
MMHCGKTKADPAAGPARTLAVATIGDCSFRDYWASGRRRFDHLLNCPPPVPASAATPRATGCLRARHARAEILDPDQVDARE